ncbi:MAG TPA: hypothetical protein PLA94_07320 [Myxococcota bacterium]|nr:hypothetical protein [Myxococcota bacterium]
MPATVAVMLMTEKPPRIVEGVVLEQAGEQLELMLPEGTSMPKPGAALVLEFPGSDQPREMASVLSVEGQKLRTKVRIRHQDQRDAARLYAGLRLSYCVVPAGTPVDVAAWMAGGEARGELHQPDPYMNFSLTGLQFEDVDRCSGGDSILFTLQLPKKRAVWRGVGRVVRVGVIPTGERESESHATHRIAMQFTELPEEARAALLDLTGRMQNNWLRNTLP